MGRICRKCRREYWASIKDFCESCSMRKHRKKQREEKFSEESIKPLMLRNRERVRYEPRRR